MLRLLSRMPLCSGQQMLFRSTRTSTQTMSASGSENNSINKRINSIQLVGRVQGGMALLQNGFNSFLLKTVHKKENSDEYYSILHSLRANQQITETKIPNLNDADLVYVDGQIIYQKFNHATGKIFSKAHVLVKRILPLSNSTTVGDTEMMQKESVNEVKILAMVGTEIQDENVMKMSVVTHNIPSTYFDESFSSNWHSIAIFDEKLKNHVRKNIKPTDRVLIKGSLRYQKISFIGTHNPQLRTFYRGNIVAESILKLIKRDVVRKEM